MTAAPLNEIILAVELIRHRMKTGRKIKLLLVRWSGKNSIPAPKNVFPLELFLRLNTKSSFLWPYAFRVGALCRSATRGSKQHFRVSSRRVGAKLWIAHSTSLYPRIALAMWKYGHSDEDIRTKTSVEGGQLGKHWLANLYLPLTHIVSDRSNAHDEPPKVVL